MRKIFDENSINDFKKILFITFITGLLAHAYCYLNANFSHDSMSYVYNEDLLIYLSQSRFTRALLFLIKGRWIYPWINGLLSLLYISISCYLLVIIFEIKKTFIIFLLCSIFSTNSSLSLLTATYMQDLDINMLALMLNVIATYILLNNDRKTIFYFCISIVLYIFSLGIYQAYIGFTLTLLLIVSFKQTINESNIKSVIVRLVINIFVIILSILLYYGISKFILILYNITPSGSYNEIGHVLSNSIEQIIFGIKLSIESTIRFIVYPNSNNVTLIMLVNILILVLYLVLFIEIIRKKSISKNKILFLLLIIILMPFTCNITTILSDMYHDLTTYSLILFYVFILLLIEMIDTKYIYIYIYI